MKIAIIGGGAAGFFSAINAKENFPDSEVVILEKSQKLLAKVKISGGGRCNVTNGCRSIKELSKAYPRGEKFLKKIFPIFNTKHAFEWFESRGVPLVVQEDGCVFPVSQDSQSIIDCLLNETNRLGVKIEIGKGVKTIKQVGNKLEFSFLDIKTTPEAYDKIIVATGGSPKRQNLEWLEKLGHKIENPVPSLFTFNMKKEPITKLMGVVVENTLVNIQGTKLKSEGPLLITHWGISGPAILKLSAFGARILSEKNYDFKVQVNWTNEQSHQKITEALQEIIKSHPNKILANYRAFSLPERLWFFLLEKAELDNTKKWQEIGKKNINKLVNILSNDIYQVKGKTTFKEEFVTCGGISLTSIKQNTMESKVVDNMYFAGELLNIDGITGGYNFQAAWSTGFLAGKLL